MTQRLCVLCMLAVVAAAAATGCGMNSAQRKTLDNVAVVSQYMQKGPGGTSMSFDAGSYKGGTAIVDQGDAAFWVKEGQGYVVNDKAHQAAPALPQAPDEIKFDDAFIAAAQSS